MSHDNNDQPLPPKAPSSLKDYLESYRPQGPHEAAGRSDGSMTYWEAARAAARGRSARDWRTEWQKQQRPPLKPRRNWSGPLLTLGLLAALGLSVYGIILLDQHLEALHWHWMNPNEATDFGDHASPGINWGGGRR